MKYKVIVSVAALLDIEQAMEWYDGQAENLGDRLNKNLYESLINLESNPH